MRYNLIKLNIFNCNRTISTSVCYHHLNMATTVKLFQLTRIYYKTLGIYPTKPNQKYAFNLTSLFSFLSMITINISSASFFFFKAETIDEYLRSFYVSFTQFGFVFCFLVNIWKASNILKLIEDYEKFIQKSE